MHHLSFIIRHSAYVRLAKAMYVCIYGVYTVMIAAGKLPCVRLYMVCMYVCVLISSVTYIGTARTEFTLYATARMVCVCVLISSVTSIGAARTEYTLYATARMVTVMFLQ